MLIIEYDPIKGKTISDGLVEKWANNILKKYTEFKAIKIVKEETVIMNITVGLSIMVDAIRVLIAKGKLSHKEVLCKFERQIIRIDKYGTMSDYPKGFCDAHNNILIKLLGW